MGNKTSSSMKINFEDVQFVVKNPENHLLISTLDISLQDCLIVNTIDIFLEEEIINNLIKQGKKEIKIIVYGKNCNDEKIFIKYNQLISLGFSNVFVYTGGMFEWLLLQDIYGENGFQTTSAQMDILKYKPNKALNISLLKY